MRQAGQIITVFAETSGARWEYGRWQTLSTGDSMKIQLVALAFSLALGLGCASADTGPDRCQPGENYDVDLCAEQRAEEVRREKRRQQRREESRFPSSNSGRSPSSY